MEYLKKMLELEYSQGNYIVVGGDWNQCPPGFAYDALSKGKEGDYVQTNVDSNIPFLLSLIYLSHHKQSCAH